ncbi:MAG: zinc carboxypeptidase [Chloroflexi bacterium]|nr:zinc carboxypeptidase [Chloroflexota bacterium]
MIRRLILAPIFAALLAALPAAAGPVRAADFPPSHAGYHTDAELAAEVAAVAAAHPDIVHLFSIGTSYQGRPLRAAKVSDNVTEDEAEPEVLVDGLHHGNEHLSLEMTLAALRILADEYGRDPTVTRLVNSREVWIVFAVNPDGAAYDLLGAQGFRDWRKNRQPNRGTTAVGTDLNRNYGYRWGCCGGSSGAPSSRLYRGARPFSAPETAALRAFVDSRVIGGRQQIKAAIGYHTFGRQVLWPYGYTKADRPADMTVDDQRAFVAIGRAMAARNGYRPMQSSDVYITDGDAIDWLYGVHRIFAYTVELGPRTASGDDPPDEVIASETRRNRTAFLHLVDRAGCPWAAVGLEVVNCGAFYDDLEARTGWSVNPDGTDTASGGRWARGDAAATTAGVRIQPGTAPSAMRVLATGLAAGTSARANDLDGGVTTVLAPAIDLPAGAGQRLTLRWSFAHGADATADDYLRVTVEGESGSAVALDVAGAPTLRGAAWRVLDFSLDEFAGQRVRIRVQAADEGAESLVEAQVDDVRVTRPTS